MPVTTSPPPSPTRPSAKSPLNTSSPEFAAAVRKAATAFYEEQEAKASSFTTGVAVGASAASVTDDLFSAFLKAVETPVVREVTWIPEVPENHPLRSLKVYVCLWNSVLWEKFFSFLKNSDGSLIPKDEPAAQERFNQALEERFWWVIAVTTCKADASILFQTADVIALNEPTLAVPYWLKSKFNGPLGRPAMESIYQTAMVFNGLYSPVENRDAKNSEATADSESSVV